MSQSVKKLRVTLKKSTIGSLPVHKLCVRGLGLRKTGSKAIIENSPENRGMINRVSHLLVVEEI